MSQNVTSGLWKFVQLTRQSSYFPALVDGAARAVGRTSSEQLVAHVAAQPAVADLITTATPGGSVDPVLEQLLTEPGARLDGAIRDAVASFSSTAATA